MIFYTLNMMCLGVLFLSFILFGVAWDSWNCCLLSNINLRIFSIIIILNIYSIPFFLLLLVVPLCVCHTFECCPTFLEYSLLFSPSLPFSFHFWDFYSRILNLRGSFFTLSSLQTSPSKTFFLSVSFSFWFLRFLLLRLYFPSILACCLLFSSQLLAC